MNNIKKIVEKIDWQFVKFLFVGGLNTLFYLCLYYLLLFFGLHYILATLFATVIGICFNFMTTGSIVFKNKDMRLIFKFFGVYAFTCFVNMLCLKALEHFFSEELNAFFVNCVNFVCPKILEYIPKGDMYVAGAITVLPIAMLSFTCFKLFVFKKTD